MCDTALSTHQQEVSRLNKLVRQLALHIDDRARLKPLAEKADIPYFTLMAAIRRGKLTADQGLRIQRAVGAQHVSLEALCPHLPK